jgi:hypothetical protein
MTKRNPFLPVLCAGTVMLATAGLASAQTDARTNTVAGPDYSSGASTGTMSEGSFNTPTADGRPGAYYFMLGVQAFKKGDYAHALDMYKVASSWAYKPAEYNLGVMYFKGQGIPADRARGAAWMILAAERGTPGYVKARDLMVTALTNAQFQHTDQIWNELKPTYGDAVALKRAKAQWARARSQMTGSRVGGVVGNLRVGETAPAGALVANPNAADQGIKPTTAAGMLTGGSVDSTVAYHQFQQSDNPYDDSFNRNRSGNVTVEPLQPVKSKAAPDKPANGGTPSPPPSSTPQGI